MGDNPVESWKKQIQWVSDNNHFSELNELMDNLWNSSGKYSQESQRWASSSTSKTRSSSCQYVTTLHGERKEIQKDVNTIHRQLRNMLANSLAVIGLSWCLDQKRNGPEPTPTNQTDIRTKLQGTWWWISQIPVTRYFGHPAPLRGELRSKKHGKKSMHFDGSDENIELLLRTVISANQLSVYGAITYLCNELSEDLGASVKLAEPDSNGETWCKNTSENSNNCRKTWNYPYYVLMRVWSLSKQDNTSTILIQKKDKRCNIYAENARCLEMRRGLVWEDGFARNARIGPVLHIKVCCLDDRYSIENQVPSLFQDNTASWVRIVNVLTSTWQNRCWPRKKRTEIRRNQDHD